jgi:hypothetical protein
MPLLATDAQWVETENGGAANSNHGYEETTRCAKRGNKKVVLRL